jgi:hypothetical protein
MNWKPLKEFDGYSISDAGVVRNDRTGKWLKNNINGDGYHVVSLKTAAGYRAITIHRLVAYAFLPPAAEGESEVAHNDGVKTNNSVLNLRWATKASNQRDRLLHGTHSRGEKSCHAVFTDKTASMIRDGSIGGGMNNSALGRMLGVSHETVRAVRSRKTYRATA